MNNLVKQEFSLAPSTFEEALKFASIIAKSSFCPSGFKGKSEDVLIAIQMGAEVGLKPMQALQNIAVINGRPSIWGDAMVALVKQHPNYEGMDEEFDEAAMKAICIVRRKGDSPTTSTFSMEDAKKANLWGKNGPWSTYPKRMLQMRARGFACRDAFPDALKGLISAEEAQDYVVKDITPKEAKKIIDEVPPHQVKQAKKIADKALREINKVISLHEVAPDINSPDADDFEPGEHVSIDGKLYFIEESGELRLCVSPEKLNELDFLFKVLEVPQETINAGVEKCGCYSIDQLSPEQVDKWIDYLKMKHKPQIDTKEQEDLKAEDIDQ